MENPWNKDMTENGKPMEQDLSEGYPEPPVLTIVISAKRAVQPISEKEE